ncbi:hypothetical protein RBSH_05199 [Rhodopirellula baltica SH28]|uniref:Uncharacterized protein n=1 Tax=Rhodopirellula baltica SH28 TaxID=993517 RepID=K5C8S1_RHOBT|nr:hypothetical protein RBSH_05199 [Rhodopirellula baltica SH28]
MSEGITRCAIPSVRKQAALESEHVDFLDADVSVTKKRLDQTAAMMPASKAIELEPQPWA